MTYFILSLVAFCLGACLGFIAGVVAEGENRRIQAGIYELKKWYK